MCVGGNQLCSCISCIIIFLYILTVIGYYACFILPYQLTSSEELSRLCRITCEHQGIPYFRFSPEIGEDVGTTEKDNHKLCEIIVR